MRRIIIATAIIAALPVMSFAFTAKNRLTVAPVNEAVFEVVGRPGSGAREYWCAAGEYARSLGVRTNTRVYIESGRQQSVSQRGKTAVRFTIAPDAAGVTPISPQLVLNVDTPGDNLSVASAVEYCNLNISRF